ncbi:MAG: ROK family protein [Verrucomicrobiae bacterium]|nr:ROK family protein [Verrucomicrobiae bacterium]
MSGLIGIDLGGTRIKGAVFEAESGRILAKDTVPTRDGECEAGEPAFVAGARRLAESLQTEAGVSASTIGVSSPGLANREATRIDFMPGRLSGLEGLVWSEVFGKPTAVVNDAHAALLGEIWQGSASGLRDAVFLTLGTGVGGAAVCDGRLLRGHLGRAGHLGHLALDFHGPPDICGTPGSLEDLVGNHSIVARSGGRFDSTHGLIEALRQGDAEAEEVWDESMRALAAGVASLINVFDPEAVIIGGGISEAWEFIEPRLTAWLDRFEWRPGGHRVPVRKAALGEWAGVYGAAYFSLRGVG